MRGPPSYPRKDKIAWYAKPNAISNAIGYAKFYSRSHDAAGNLLETHEQFVSVPIVKSIIKVT
jgi:hypothetical protein